MPPSLGQFLGGAVSQSSLLSPPEERVSVMFYLRKLFTVDFAPASLFTVPLESRFLRKMRLRNADLRSSFLVNNNIIHVQRCTGPAVGENQFSNCLRQIFLVSPTNQLWVAVCFRSLSQLLTPDIVIVFVFRTQPRLVWPEKT